MDIQTFKTILFTSKEPIFTLLAWLYVIEPKYHTVTRLKVQSVINKKPHKIRKKQYKFMTIFDWLIQKKYVFTSFQDYNFVKYLNILSLV